MTKLQVSIEGSPNIVYAAQYNETSIATGRVVRPAWSQTSTDPHLIPFDSQRANAKSTQIDDLSTKTEK
jgi:hypothetical protein